MPLHIAETKQRKCSNRYQADCQPIQTVWLLAPLVILCCIETFILVLKRRHRNRLKRLIQPNLLESRTARRAALADAGASAESLNLLQQFWHQHDVANYAGARIDYGSKAPPIVRKLIRRLMQEIDKKHLISALSQN